MSTLPGDDALRDAGLTNPDLDETVNLEDHHPGTPRPDLDGEADEADMIDQAQPIPESDDEAHP